jgi:hypothetical protein
MVSLLDVFWFIFQEVNVVFYEVEFAIVNVHMSSPWLFKGITRRDICPVLTQSVVPRIPIRFIYDDNSRQEKTTPLIYAVSDSGADAVIIPEELANCWNLQLQLLPVNTRINTASGIIQTHKAKIDFLIG